MNYIRIASFDNLEQFMGKVVHICTNTHRFGGYNETGELREGYIMIDSHVQFFYSQDVGHEILGISVKQLVNTKSSYGFQCIIEEDFVSSIMYIRNITDNELENIRASVLIDGTMKFVGVSILYDRKNYPIFPEYEKSTMIIENHYNNTIIKPFSVKVEKLFKK